MRSFECQYVFDGPCQMYSSCEIAPEFPNQSRASFVIRKNAPNFGNPRLINQTNTKSQAPFHRHHYRCSVPSASLQRPSSLSLSASLNLLGRPLRAMPSPLLYLLLILLTTLPSTYYIYNYPTLHNCAWPDSSAPFRLLAIGDPQIEGDKKQRSWRGTLSLKLSSRGKGLMGA